MISDWRLPDKISILPSTYYDNGIQNLLQRVYYRRRDGMSVIVTEESHEGKWWQHVSCAFNKKGKLPSWNDLKEVKNIFIGRFKKAIQILPNEKNYVNIHPQCLHLFHCPDDGLPDFTHEGML